MSELETKIQAVLDKFEQDVSNVSDKLQPLLEASDVDKLSTNESTESKPVPYALSAYALSSMLFAYLRSEGQDTAMVMPELARVKEKMDKLNAKRTSSSNDSTQAGKDTESPKNPEVQGESKSSGKHTRFDSSNDSKKPKSGKRVSSKASSPGEEEGSEKKRKSTRKPKSESRSKKSQ